MEEPDALVAHVRICAGGASNWAGGPTALTPGHPVRQDQAGATFLETFLEETFLDTHQTCCVGGQRRDGCPEIYSPEVLQADT